MVVVISSVLRRNISILLFGRIVLRARLGVLGVRRKRMRIVWTPRRRLSLLEVFRMAPFGSRLISIRVFVRSRIRKMVARRSRRSPRGLRISLPDFTYVVPPTGGK